MLYQSSASTAFFSDKLVGQPAVLVRSFFVLVYIRFLIYPLVVLWFSVTLCHSLFQCSPLYLCLPMMCSSLLFSIPLSFCYATSLYGHGFLNVLWGGGDHSYLDRFIVLWRQLQRLKLIPKQDGTSNNNIRSSGSISI